MSKTFKPGDRVRYTGAQYNMASREAWGATGTVVSVHDGVKIKWDKDWPIADLCTTVMPGNIELIDTFAVGDRVVFVGELVSLKGKAGMFKAYRDATMANVIFDHESRTRVVNLSNLRPEPKPMTNIKNAVKVAIDGLFPKTGTSLNGLARELLVATSASSAAEARKKKAKTAAIDGGLVLAEYRPGEVTSFDDAEFTVVAKTSEPTSRLDQEMLRAQLSAAGLSKAKIDKAFVAATVENKAATSYQVVQK